jgi:hypothetical protein
VIAQAALVLLGLLQADAAGAPASQPSASSAPVVVALPVNAGQAILVALNRLRGEAASVGFEVRFVDAGVESISLGKLDDIARSLGPAALVAFNRPEGGAQPRRAMDVWFMDRQSGKTSFVHLTAEGESEGDDRADVILAVRAVDFIRARMFDTLTGRRPPPPEQQETKETIPDHRRRKYLGAGLAMLTSFDGFQPAFAPQLELGYHVTPWLRVGAIAFGLGTRPHVQSLPGRVSLDQRLLALGLAIRRPLWRRLHWLAEAGGGEYWVVVRGSALAPNIGRSATLSSLGAFVSAGLAVQVLPHVGIDLLGGTLWLQHNPEIYSDQLTYLGSIGRPTWLACLRLAITL